MGAENSRRLGCGPNAFPVAAEYITQRRTIATPSSRSTSSHDKPSASETRRPLVNSSATTGLYRCVPVVEQPGNVGSENGPGLGLRLRSTDLGAGIDQNDAEMTGDG